ncbi:prohead assembly (scaffolding) protein [Citrobacter phage Ci1]|nr:prohead assembly (scaffolding) protein [Citrobacter phage Ci1]
MTEQELELRLDEAKAKLEIFGEDSGAIIDHLIEDDATLALAMISVQEGLSLSEVIVKHVDSKGVITRTKDRESRKRLAYQTTGLTTAKRRLIARKAAKTRKANPTIVVRAMRKKKRAEKRRAAMGM